MNGIAESLNELGDILRARPLLALAAGIPLVALAVGVAWVMPGKRGHATRLQRAAFPALISAAVGAGAVLVLQRALAEGGRSAGPGHRSRATGEGG